MIKVKIPSNNIQERKYILNIIFEEFLGLEYKLIIDNGELKIKDWVIELENGKSLNIKDTFFNKYPNDREYLKRENIPKRIEELDVFATSFFMLTRWEEYVNKNRDSHNRFPATESLAYKQGFLDRPIVNEYVEWLKNELLKLDNNLAFKKREFEFVLTHDVDHILKWNSLKKIMKHLLGDIVLRKSIKEFFSTLSQYFLYKRKLINDPFDTFDYLMDISDKLNIKSYFFFMGEGETRYDNNYNIKDKVVSELISKIKKREHKIGIHPTYNAYNSLTQFKREKRELEGNFNAPIKFGREHYLRFEIPTTWQIWEDEKMQWDSTLGYADKVGFRAGVCYEYSVFNILTREKLNLKEKPLIVMEESVVKEKDITSDNMEQIITDLINKVKYYNGEFVFLWHNSSFNTNFWARYKKVYETVLFRSINNV